MLQTSIAKQNYSTESEDALNQQIQIDQIAQQQYLSTAAYFDRDDVALPVSFSNRPSLFWQLMSV